MVGSIAFGFAHGKRRMKRWGGGFQMKALDEGRREKNEQQIIAAGFYDEIFCVHSYIHG